MPFFWWIFHFFSWVFCKNGWTQNKNQFGFVIWIDQRMESGKKIFVNAKFVYSEGMTHSFFELFLHFDQKWSTTLACLFFREIGFSESLIFLAKIKKIQGASKPTGWKFVNLAHFGGNWITKLANFRPKILFFWPFSFSQK